jgi:hypothetical protein
MGTFGDAEIVAGIITANPGLITRGLAQKSALGFMKWLNNPNRLIKSMFQQADKVNNFGVTPKIIRNEGKVPIPRRTLPLVRK